MWLYALTIFLSAFLLFQVQPLIGKCILPWFGGGPSVWTTCMLFFQIVLLAGYSYAHLIRTKLSERAQVIVHAIVLVAAIVLLPIGPSVAWKPHGGDNPVWWILGVLAAGVGLPYFALSATSPLIQAWFSSTHPGRSPYRLYALSNLGSLLALGTYPFLVEPNLRLGMQESTWSALFVAFVVLCVGCALLVWKKREAAGAPVLAMGGAGAGDLIVEVVTSDSPAPVASAAGGVAGRVDFSRWVLWLLLPACGSVMLLATTNQMCADVGVFPFLWVVPLGLYLLSFILCFESDRIYLRPVFWPLLIVVAIFLINLMNKGVNAPITLQIAGYSAAVFICCMVCHGELSRLRPEPRYLTAFYLMMSAGGALGGILVTLVAPLVFVGYYELHIGLVACFVLAGAACLYGQWRRGRLLKSWVLPVVAVFTLTVSIGLGLALVSVARKDAAKPVSESRNFYGTLTVNEYNKDYPDWRYFSLTHGRILHGSQYAEEPLSREPITYYGNTSGVGRAVLAKRGLKPLKIGVVGLGTGTMAAWVRGPEEAETATNAGSAVPARGSDSITFYEINPAVPKLSGAGGKFTYLEDCEGKCDIVMGDARLSMEREVEGGRSQGYDLLVLDAFSSDAIPIHLLTAEAFEIYVKELKPDGVLAVHVSNRYLDLKPVVLAQAERLGLGVAMIDDELPDTSRVAEMSTSNWVLVTADKAFLESPEVAGGAADPASVKTRLLWTDDYSDLFSIINWSVGDFWGDVKKDAGDLWHDIWPKKKEPETSATPTSGTDSAE